MTVHQIIEGVREKNLEATLLFVDYSKTFYCIYKGKMEQILMAHDLSDVTVSAIIMLYKNTKGKVCSPDDESDSLIFFAGDL